LDCGERTLPSEHELVPVRRFPPPWIVEEQPACFVVRDHNGQALAYVYFEDQPGRRSAAKLSTKAFTEDGLKSGPNGSKGIQIKDQT
jgi:hypothetical protein